MHKETCNCQDQSQFGFDAVNFVERAIGISARTKLGVSGWLIAKRDAREEVEFEHMEPEGEA